MESISLTSNFLQSFIQRLSAWNFLFSSICFLDSPIPFPYLRFDATRWRLSSCCPVTSPSSIPSTSSHPKYSDTDTNTCPTWTPRIVLDQTLGGKSERTKRIYLIFKKFRVYSLFLDPRWSLLLMVHSHCGVSFVSPAHHSTAYPFFFLPFLSPTGFISKTEMGLFFFLVSSADFFWLQWVWTGASR